MFHYSYMVEVEIFNKIIGNLLRKERENTNSGIIKYSNEVNISHSFINKLEKGRAKISLYELFKYCEGLNITPSAVVKELEDLIDLENK